MKYIILSFVTALCCSSTFAQTPSWLPTDGLVAWYPFNGNANDESNHGNNGTVIGAVLNTDRFGNPSSAYSFNGVNDQIVISDAPSIRVRRITLSAWVKPNSSALMQIFCKSRVTDAHFESYFMATVYQFGFKSNASCSSLVNPWSRFDYNTLPDPNAWHFYTSTYDGITVNNYVDGNLITTNISGTGLIDTCAGGDLRIGYCWNGNPLDFNGLMDDMAIYNRALSACEIQQLYLQSSATVTTQPVTQTVPNGSTVQFSITAPGTILYYQWQQNNGTGFVNLSNAGIYSNTATNTLTIGPINASLNNTTYRCIVGSTAVCPDTSDEAVLKINFSAVGQLSQSKRLIVAPNPAHDQVTIIVGRYLIGQHFLLTDGVGQIITTGKLELETTKLNVKDFATGVYYLRLEGSEDVYKVVKL